MRFTFRAPATIIAGALLFSLTWSLGQVENSVAEAPARRERPTESPPALGPSVPPSTSGPAGIGWHENEQMRLLGSFDRFLPGFEPLSSSLAAPLSGRITSGFGYRNVSVGGNRNHGGIDLSAEHGSEVRAAADGLVARAGWGGAYGYAIYLDHEGGAQTRYAHLSELFVDVGQFVRQGDVVGLSGSSGASTGPHLHFELRIGGSAVDPLPYLLEQRSVLQEP